MHLLIKGAVLGFLIAAPVGPIGLLCITRTLRSGFPVGFVSGLGAATADAAYGCVAAFGVKALTATIAAVAAPLHIAGAAFLCYLGIKTFVSKPAAAEALDGMSAAPAAYASTVMLTLLNPLTIFSFVAIFASALGAKQLTVPAASLLVAGVFVGSAIWWLTLAGGVAFSRSRLSEATIARVNAFSALLLIGFAIYAVFTR